VSIICLDCLKPSDKYVPSALLVELQFVFMSNLRFSF
jgi:hypothetical protein